MRNGGPPPAHLLSSTLAPFDASRWLQPPQHAPNIGTVTASTPPTDPLLAAIQCAINALVSALCGDLRAIGNVASAFRADFDALGVDLNHVLLAPRASAATKLADNEQSGVTCAKQLQQEATACQHMDNEGTKAEWANDEEGRAERADDEQGRAERKLALTCLGYKQEWPSLAKAKER
jgi:hypothetical protein